MDVEGNISMDENRKRVDDIKGESSLFNYIWVHKWELQRNLQLSDLHTRRCIHLQWMAECQLACICSVLWTLKSQFLAFFETLFII